MAKNIYPILDAYAKGKIDTVNINMDYDIISVAISNEYAEPTEIIFEDVKAFYYIDHDMEIDHMLSNTQLSAISYDDLGFGEFSTKSQDDLFVSVPQFALNINDSSLYIDAEKIRINNEAYQV